MNKPETFLSSIVRGDGVYIQAFIFSVRNGYIHSKSVRLTNLTDNTFVTYELEEGDNITCLFKFVQKLNPSLDSNFKVELLTRVYSYDSNSIVEYVDRENFVTPAIWVNNDRAVYSLFLNASLKIGSTSVEPTLKVILSGGHYSAGMSLRVCGSNSLSNIISYNSFDIKSDIEVQENIYLYEKLLSLNLSGNWYFKAFLTLSDGTIISQSDTIIHTVNQGDLYLAGISLEDVIKKESGEEYRLNQLIDGKRVGITTFNEDRTVQTGSYYEFHENSGAWYYELINNLEANHRLPTMAELFSYQALKESLQGIPNQPLYYYSSEYNRETNQILGIDWVSGAPRYLNPGDANVGYLLLEDFVNKLSEPKALEIPVIKRGAKLQASGFKVTDLVTKQDAKTLVNQIGDLSLLEVTYAELTGIIARGELVPYKRYLITDYQTVHIIPNAGVVNTGEIEPLMVTAFSASRLNNIAYSSLYPNDTIYYEVENNQEIVPGCTKGYIYRRVDEKQNNDFPMDFRQVKFRRWAIAQAAWSNAGPYAKGEIVKDSSSDTLYISLEDSNTENPATSAKWGMLPWLNGDYISPFFDQWQVVGNQKGILDTSEDFEDYSICANISNYSNWTNNKIEQNTTSIIDNCNTVIFSQWFSNNKIGHSFKNNTLSGSMGNEIKNTFSNNLISEDFERNTISDNFNNNMIFAAFSRNKIDSAFSANIAMNEFAGNKLDIDIYENLFGMGFAENIIGSHFSYNTIGNGFTNNDVKNQISFSDFSQSSILYNDFYKEVFKSQSGGILVRYVDDNNQQNLVHLSQLSQ